MCEHRAALFECLELLNVFCRVNVVFFFADKRLKTDV